MKFTNLLILAIAASTAEAIRFDGQTNNQTMIQKKDGVQDQKEKNEKDIANKEVRPDVYQVVSKMIDPVRERRPENPPKPDRTWEDGPKKADEESFAKKANKARFADLDKMAANWQM